MAIIDNVDLVVTYDGNFQVTSPRILANEAPHNDEHAAQCICVEMLRGLLASAMTVEDYNNMSNEDWESYKEAAVFRASLNVVAPVNHLDMYQKEAAANIGGNFFEHGYEVIIGNTQISDRVQFTKLGGV